MVEIANANLGEHDLPPPNAGWSVLNRFALTFNGYSHWGSFEKCAEIGNSSFEHYKEKGLLPQTLTELRTCLFFEQRRWRHFGDDPDTHTMAYLHALVEAIRARVHARQFD
jgi:hypothetical protein